jgi:hypothetical protein
MNHKLKTMMSRKITRNTLLFNRGSSGFALGLGENGKVTSRWQPGVQQNEQDGQPATSRHFTPEQVMERGEAG